MARRPEGDSTGTAAMRVPLTLNYGAFRTWLFAMVDRAVVISPAHVRDRIVAEPGTLTGSIGVLSGKVAVGKTIEMVGLEARELGVGKNALFQSGMTPKAVRSPCRKGCVWLCEAIRSAIPCKSAVCLSDETLDGVTESGRICSR